MGERESGLRPIPAERAVRMTCYGSDGQISRCESVVTSPNTEGAHVVEMAAGVSL
jgi:hypothetical protein